MPITVFTFVWAAIGLLSLIGLFCFNTKKNFFSFATRKEYLLPILIASLLGMREIYPFACILFAGTLIVMLVSYSKITHRQSREYKKL